jgi:hypothetical protein
MIGVFLVVHDEPLQSALPGMFVHDRPGRSGGIRPRCFHRCVHSVPPARLQPGSPISVIPGIPTACGDSLTARIHAGGCSSASSTCDRRPDGHRASPGPRLRRSLLPRRCRGHGRLGKTDCGVTSCVPSVFTFSSKPNVVTRRYPTRQCSSACGRWCSSPAAESGLPIASCAQPRLNSD